MQLTALLLRMRNVFDRHYVIHLVTSPEDQAQVRALRREARALLRGGGLDAAFDEGDTSLVSPQRDLQLLMRDRQTGDALATGTLVFAQAQVGLRTLQLPGEAIAPDCFEIPLLRAIAGENMAIGELAHWVVREDWHALGLNSPEAFSYTDAWGHGFSPQLHFACVSIGLWLGLMALADLCHLDTTVNLCPPRLFQLLQVMGQRMVQLGATVDHHGPRLPIAMRVEPAVRELPLSLRPVYHQVLEQLRHELARSDVRISVPDYEHALVA